MVSTHENGRPAAAGLLSYRKLEQLTNADLARLQEIAATVVRERLAQLDLFAPPAQPQPAAAPAAAPQQSTDLAAVLSPSQVSCFMRCQAQWYFKYFRNLPDTQNANRALGNAVHAAMSGYFAHRLASPDAPLEHETVIAWYREAWILEAGRTEFADGEDADAIGAQGEGIMRLLLREWAHKVQPAKVDARVEGVIGGVRVRGYVDLIDTHGRVIDIKTASKSPCGVRPEYSFQVATYQLLGATTSGARVITAVKTKTPKVIEQTVDVDPEAVKMAERLYPLAQEAMRAGYYFPNRQSILCSRKNCGYWRECEAEFGGRVPGGDA